MVGLLLSHYLLRHQVIYWLFANFNFNLTFVIQLSEISIPHFLTASIFSAQSGELMVFRRNVLLLVLFSVTSGICRSGSCTVEKLPVFMPTKSYSTTLGLRLLFCSWLRFVPYLARGLDLLESIPLILYNYYMDSFLLDSGL